MYMQQIIFWSLLSFLDQEKSSESTAFSPKDDNVRCLLAGSANSSYTYNSLYYSAGIESSTIKDIQLSSSSGLHIENER